MWFEDLTGFAEESPEQVRTNLSLAGERLTSRVNGRVLHCGRLETPTLGELRGRLQALSQKGGKISVCEMVADVQQLHLDPANAGALFQVASQFNLLEMVSPNVTPEQGVGIYQFDHTQGPACAIAAGAGTIFRNYFANVNGQTGQSANNQIDCLAGMGAALDNSGSRLWRMVNGYALASEEGLVETTKRLNAASEKELDELRQQLRIGIQWNTQVTLHGAAHTVSQAYCSALPVAYTHSPAQLWAPFDRLVLDAAYEATLCTAMLNALQSGNNRVFLTLLGGGAFGNEMKWITGALQRAMTLYDGLVDLDAVIVSYGSANPWLQTLLK